VATKIDEPATALARRVDKYVALEALRRIVSMLLDPDFPSEDRPLQELGLSMDELVVGHKGETDASLTDELWPPGDLDLEDYPSFRAATIRAEMLAAQLLMRLARSPDFLLESAANALEYDNYTKHWFQQWAESQARAV
jgi:hypothetical protein